MRPRAPCLLLACALWIPACAPAPRHEYELAPGQAYAAGLHKVLLLPINETEDLPEGLAKGEDEVFSLIRDHLEAQGLEVETTTPADFGKLLREATEAVRRELRSGNTSVARDVSYADVIPYVTRGLESEADLVILPNMVLRAGEWEGRSLRWDGVRRRAPGTTRLKMSGNSLAASLYVVVYQPDGSLVFRGYGGLDLLWAVNRSEEKMDLIEDRLEDPDNLREGVCIAFYPYFGAEKRC